MQRRAEVRASSLRQTAAGLQRAFGFSGCSRPRPLLLRAPAAGWAALSSAGFLPTLLITRIAAMPMARPRAQLQVLACCAFGVAMACLLVTRPRAPRHAELLGWSPAQQLVEERSAPPRAQQLGPKAASYVRRWTEAAETAAVSPKAQILALKAQGVPVIFPTSVTDASGRLQKAFKPQALAAMQKPSFAVVPESQSSKLACKCATCQPLAGFPPVCQDCKCQEAANPDAFTIGHTRACAEGKCADLGEEEGGEDAGSEAEEDEEGAEAPAPGPAENKFNALLDFPECEWWSCYDKDGWFCACTCPGQGCL